MQNIYNDWSLSLINFRLCDDISNYYNACFELTYIIQISSDSIILFQQSFKHRFLVTLHSLRLTADNMMSSDHCIILLSSYSLLHLQQRLEDLNYRYRSFELITFVSSAVENYQICLDQWYHFSLQHSETCLIHSLWCHSE
jgi:hypothetical protein